LKDVRGMLRTLALTIPLPERVLRLRFLVGGRGLEPLEREFRKRGPWATRVRIGGRDFGGAVDLSGDERIADFFAAFPGCRMVLELGSLEGAHTFQLADRVEGVVGVEGRRRNVEKERFVQRLLGVENVTFVEADLQTLPLASLGRFDAVFCSGLLYHLPRPWLLLDQFSAVTGNVLVSTHYAAEATREVDGIPGRWTREFGLRDPLSGLSRRSFWMTLPALIARLEENGYAVEVIRRDPEHPNGPIVTLVGRSSAV
jgi:SAM-dependent methyltransferase